MTNNLPATNMVAVADKRYLHKYYLPPDETEWQLIVNCKTIGGLSDWTTVTVDTKDGRPLGKPLTYQADIWATRFADRPFTEGSLETEWDWFKRLATQDGWSGLRVTDMYQKYLERRRFCSSYDAMVRIGMRKAIALDCPQKPVAKAKDVRAELKALFGE